MTTMDIHQILKRLPYNLRTLRQLLKKAAADFRVLQRTGSAPARSRLRRALWRSLRKAVRLAERLRPHILILDLMMPGLNGLDALRLIRQRSPRTRVVVLSMYANEGFVSEALQCGAP